MTHDKLKLNKIFAIFSLLGYCGYVLSTLILKFSIRYSTEVRGKHYSNLKYVTYMMFFLWIPSIPQININVFSLYASAMSGFYRLENKILHNSAESSLD